MNAKKRYDEKSNNAHQYSLKFIAPRLSKSEKERENEEKAKTSEMENDSSQKCNLHRDVVVPGRVSDFFF